MCGINGIFKLNGDIVVKDELAMMNSKMIHRGPDDEGYYLDKNLGLSIRRLSIIDIHGGHQPISNEDGRYSVVLNGEIYNYLELKNELECKGHVFKTKSDTEVLVHLYEEIGEKLLEKLNGMFVFAIWDSYKRELFIASDRLGIKPLFYYKNNHFFYFSSELKSLLKLNFNKNIDYTSFLLYLFLLYIPYPKSIVDQVYKLEPATYLRIDEQGHIVKKSYWTADNFSADTKFNIIDFKEEFLYLLSDAVRLQLRSDVPVGTFLSGGIDSSSVVAMLSKLRDGNPVRTFSIGYEGHYTDERPHALKVSRLYNTEHVEVFLTSSDVRDSLRRIVWFMDEPIGDSAAIPTFLLSQIAHESGVKVILNGTGGDEIFGGYRRYLRSDAKNYIHDLFGTLTNLIFSITQKNVPFNAVSKLINPLLNYCCQVNGSFVGLTSFLKNDHWLGIFLDGLNSALGEKFNTLHNRSGADRFMNFDLKTYLVGDLLFLLDKMTMAASIEGRVPLLDHRMVEFMSKIPSNLKIKEGNFKSLVKQAMRDMLPNEILSRDKMGFGGPVFFWLYSDAVYKSGIAENDVSPITMEIFDIEKIKKTITDKKYNRWNIQFIYNLCVFELWYKDVFKEN